MAPATPHAPTGCKNSVTKRRDGQGIRVSQQSLLEQEGVRKPWGRERTKGFLQPMLKLAQILDPVSGKPSVHVQQVKWEMQALTERQAVTCDRATRRTGKISSIGQDLLTGVWKTEDLYAFIFPLEAVVPYRESIQQKTQNHTSAAVSPTARAPAASSLLPAGLCRGESLTLNATIQGSWPPQQQKKAKLYKTCIVLLLSSLASSDLNSNESV